MKNVVKRAEAPTVNPSLLDVHRPTPRAKGGRYTADNIIVMTPVSHMKEHGNYREREKQLDDLKALMDERTQMLKTKNAMANRILASERGTDLLDQKTKDFLNETVVDYNKHLKRFEKRVEKHLKAMDKHPIVERMLEIKGVGPIAVAQIMRYIDIEKAQYASSLWAYVGYDKPKHKRQTKGEAGGGNKTLRSALFVLADSFIKQRNVYRDIYDMAKANYQVSEKLTMTRVTGKTGVHEMKWKDVSDGHRHGAAIRKMMKHYLADLWYVWRTLEGLETRSLYVEEKLGHTGIIKPWERGWAI